MIIIVNIMMIMLDRISSLFMK